MALSKPIAVLDAADDFLHDDLSQIGPALVVGVARWLAAGQIFAAGAAAGCLYSAGAAAGCLYSAGAAAGFAAS